MSAPASPGRLLRRLASFLLRGPGAPFVIGDLEEALRRDVERGMSPRRARARYARNLLASALTLGLHREHPRIVATAPGGGPVAVVRGVGRDLAHAARALARSWAFSLVCLVSVAGGVGITLTVFMLYRATMEAPFDVESDGLVEVLPVGVDGDDPGWSYPDFVDLEAATGSMSMSAWAVGEGSLRLDDAEAGERVDLAWVSADYFETLGVGTAVGRGLAEDGGAGTGATPVVLAHGFWRNQMDGAPDVVGRVVTLNRSPHVVVGVAPEGFRFHRVGFSAHAWVPLESHPAIAGDGPRRHDRGAGWLGIVGRLRGGTTPRQAEAAVASVVSGLRAARADTAAGSGPRVLPWHWQGADVVAGGDALLIRTLFTGLSGTVLLIVCLNLAGMVFVRSASRERELALRLAIGSSRRRLVQYLMAEAAVLAAAGGVLVAAVAWGSLRLLSWRLQLPLPSNAQVDLTTVGVCMGLALATTLVFGLLPALRFSRPELLSALKDDGGTGGGRAGRLHRWAASLQTGIAVPVLVVAGGVTQGALSLGSAELGLREEGLVVWTPSDLAADGYDAAGVEDLARALVQDVGRIPRVEAVAVADGLPLDGQSSPVAVSTEEGAIRVQSDVTRVGPGYLQALGTPILRGRAIEEGDGAGAEPVAVLTASLAEELFPGQSPLGRRVRLEHGSDSVRPYTVVGVSGNLAGATLESSPDHVFLSLRQEPGTTLALAVRASSVNDDLVAAMREVPLALDPGLARPQVAPYESVVKDASLDFAIWSVFFSLMAALLLMLSALGVYGVIGFTVARRTREIGVRMSLGSSRGQVLRDVLGDAVKLALPGLLLGGLLGVAVARSILNQIYVDIGLPMANAPVLALAAAAALAVVLLASTAPARRASRIDPMEALRTE